MSVAMDPASNPTAKATWPFFSPLIGAACYLRRESGDVVVGDRRFFDGAVMVGAKIKDLLQSKTGAPKTRNLLPAP